MLDSVQRLDECEADFGAIERHLENLKEKIKNSLNESLVTECIDPIICHERIINRQITHFNHSLGQHISSDVLDIDPPNRRTLESIDEIVRLHLHDSGYASIAELMQKENPEALGLDFTIKSGIIERAVESAMYEITDGDLGSLIEVKTPSQSVSVDHDQALLLDYFNSRQKEGTAIKLQRIIETLKRHMCASSFPTPDPRWAKTKAVEYKFLKHFSEGNMEALQFLRAAGLDPDCDTELISRLAGKLATSDQEEAEYALYEFVVSLRAELLAMSRPSESEYSTDLMRMMDKTPMQSNLVALQSMDFIPGGELPTEIELSKQNWFHPILVCPVEKEQIPHNQLGVLSCGHILSAKAVNQLSRLGGTVICPCCSERSDVASIRKCSLFT